MQSIRNTAIRFVIERMSLLSSVIITIIKTSTHIVPKPKPTGRQPNFHI